MKLFQKSEILFFEGGEETAEKEKIFCFLTKCGFVLYYCL